MSDEKPKALVAALPTGLARRGSNNLVSRGLRDISEDDFGGDMLSWLNGLPDGSSLLGLSFVDDSPLFIGNDHREAPRRNNKRAEEKSNDERLCELLEDRITGLPSLQAFREDEEENKARCTGYIELEGVYPFERSTRLLDVGSARRNLLLQAAINHLRRVLAGYSTLRIYSSGGETLFQFRSADLKEVLTFVEHANAELRRIIVKIRKPDGAIVTRLAGLRLDLPRRKA